MRRTRDFAALGISDDRGNWDDGWVLTGAIRSALNVVFARYGLTTGYQSETTFIFVHSWEERAFYQLGKMLKSRLSEIVISLVPRTRPPKVYFGSYWGNEPGLKGQFNLLFPDEASMQQALPFRWDIRTHAKAAMRTVDQWAFCEDHDVGLELYYAGMWNLPPLYRED